MGIGNVVLGSPMALIAAFSSGEMPGWDSRYFSNCSTVTWDEVATGALVSPTISCGRAAWVMSEPAAGLLMLP